MSGSAVGYMDGQMEMSKKIHGNSCKQFRDIEGEKWLCLGDFNSIMWSTEKKGGRDKPWHNMSRFRDIVRFCNLCDLGSRVILLRGQNGRTRDENVKERLDRALANASWKSTYPNFMIHHLPRYKSDHAPVTMDCEGNEERKGQHRQRRGFHFEHMWLQYPNFQEVVTGA